MDNEVFIGGWTREKLRERSQSERYSVWKRARALHSAEGNHLARAIESMAEADQLILGLRYIDRLAFEEISAILEIGLDFHLRKNHLQPSQLGLD